MKQSTKDIIEENKKRKSRFTEKYDPIRGVGSHINRFPITMGRYGKFYLPVIMKKEPLIQDILHKRIKVDEYILLKMYNLRRKFDFEYYAYIAFIIKHKETGKKVKFLLNYPQRAILLPTMYKQIEEKKPIRIDLVKARQWGGSTLIDAFTVWIQREVKESWNGCIVTDVEDQARNIRGMTTTFSKEFPEDLGTLTLRNFEGSTKNKRIEETESVISIGSMQKPDSLRSADLKLAHLSEVGLWKKTDGKSPKDLIQSLRGTIPRLPWTMFILESTAKGIGNYFHDQYLLCKEGKSDMTLVFVAWWNIERYQEDVPRKEIERFISSWNDYEQWLWSLGATIEGINWYRFALGSEFDDDDWAMKSEYPSTADEAFQSSGQRYFPAKYVAALREYNCPPEMQGELTADDIGNRYCLDNIDFCPDNKGKLKIWMPPDLSEAIARRYIVSVDVGGRHKKADYSIIRVLDRYNMMWGDAPEIVATWKGHLDYDLVAWKAAQIATWYNKAMLVIESNFYDNKAEVDEGNQFFTVLDTIADYYDNLYTRTSPEKIREGAPVQWGFHTNKQTKPMILAHFLKEIREITYIEPMKECCNELDSFEIKPNGTTGAVEGSHDDIVIATAILLWVSRNQYDPPKVIKKVKRNQNRVINDASF